MNSYSAHLRDLILRSTLASLCGIAVGLLRFGTAIGDLHVHQFAVIPYAIMISLFFFILRDSGPREAVFTLLGLFLLNAGFFTKSLLRGTLITDALYISALGVATVTYWQLFYQKRPSRRALEPALLGVLIGTFTVAARVAATVFAGSANTLVRAFPGWLLSVMHTVSVEFFVGLGVGVGILLCDYKPVGKALKFSGAEI